MPGRRNGPVVIIAALSVGVWLVFGRLLAPFDLIVFLTAGREVLHGYSPYVPITTPAFAAGHAFVYPYIVAWVFAPLSVLPRHAAMLVYSGLSVAAIAYSCRLLRDRWARAAALVLVCSTTIVGLQMGTLNALLLLGLAAAWRNRDRPWACGVIVGVLAVAKLFLAPVVVWLLLSRRYRASLAAVLTGASTLLAGFALGPIGPSRYLRMVSALQAREAMRSWSLTSLLRNLGLGQRGALVGVVVAAAVVVACGRRFGRNEPAVFGAAVLASLVVSPIVWSSYLVLLAVPLLAAGVGDGALVACAIGSWLLVTPDAASPARAGLGAAAAVAVSAAGAWSWLRARAPGPLRVDRRTALSAAAVVIGAAAAAGASVVLPERARTPFAVAVAVAGVLALSTTTWRTVRPAPA